ncbi:MAG: formyltransferase family protein [Candidatus Pacebacteria bacterium]|nr:formyltransferase family protein [Candidatus Paceibacterota bacterium]
MKKIIIFASGTKDGGGSGFENMVNASRGGVLNCKISAVVSNHENGGVRQRADKLGIKFIHFLPPYTAERYKEITKDADLVCLSGWLKLVVGLNPQKTINIHPGPLPRFGGQGMYGHHVHEAVVEAYKAGTVTHSAVSMHFVTDEYDRGPLFFSKPVKISPNDTAETLAKKVIETEHKWQPIITEKVLMGEISWDGKNPESLRGQIIK